MGQPLSKKIARPGARAKRPNSYTPELGARICSLMVEGRSMRSICRRKDMPAISTIFDWLVDEPRFAEQYARGYEMRADAIFEDTILIADGTAKGADVQRDRLRVDTRKWFLSRMDPKKYGDRLQMANDPLNPVSDPVATARRDEAWAQLVQMLDRLAQAPIQASSGLQLTSPGPADVLEARPINGRGSVYTTVGSAGAKAGNGKS